MATDRALLKKLEAALEELEESDFDDAWPAVLRARDALAKPAHAALAPTVKKIMLEDDEQYLVWARVYAGMLGADALDDLIALAAAGETDNRLNEILFELFDASPARAEKALTTASKSKKPHVVAFATYARDFLPKNSKKPSTKKPRAR
ncbi:MAG TPA: hypothetical protein VGH87_18720 [Polyangiaceae bacterium]